MVRNNRLLIVDDNPSIHEDFVKIFSNQISAANSDLYELEDSLFGSHQKSNHLRELKNEFNNYELVHAYSGKEALKKVETALEQGRPFALAFVDERMPPGWDGIETIAKIWEIDPDIEIVICTAFSDYAWEEIIEKLGATNHLLLLKKPFDIIEVKQMVLALIEKWGLARQTRNQEAELQLKVREQTTLINSMYTFANKLHTLNSLDEVFDCILDNIKIYLGCKRISIMMLNEETQKLTIKKAIGLSEEIVKLTSVKFDEGIVGHVFTKGEILITNDMESAGYQKKYSGADAFMSFPLLCAPLIGPKMKLGVINVTEKENNQPFIENDKKIMSYICNAASIAITNQLNEIKVENHFIGMISALTEVIDAKDHYTRGHCERVSEISCEIASSMGLSAEEIRIIGIAALLHDIGKIGISETILCKPDRLTDEEFYEIKEHPVIGDNILKGVTFLEKAREIIRHHHERLDGSGYPDGLHAEKLSLGAKIVAVADVFDAMSSERPYRKGIPLEDIKNVLLSMKDVKLDIKCIEALFKFLDIKAKH